MKSLLERLKGDHRVGDVWFYPTINTALKWRTTKVYADGKIDCTSTVATCTYQNVFIKDIKFESRGS